MLETAHDLRLSDCEDSAIRILNSWYKQWFIIIIIVVVVVVVVVVVCKLPWKLKLSNKPYISTSG